MFRKDMNCGIRTDQKPDDDNDNIWVHCVQAVSYTHLDVYKRQVYIVQR